MVIPTVGSAGHYDLAAPFDSIIVANQQYTCKEVRTISGMIANNEDPLKSVYVPAGLTEDNYKDDLAVDMRIVSLQAGTGHWVYVPARYITKFPDTNGVPYRHMGIAVQLPPVPANIDMSYMLSEIQALVKGYIGVDPVIRLAETSYTVMVPDAEHKTLQLRRQAAATTQGSTLWHRLRTLQTNYDALKAQHEKLEEYVKTTL